MRSDALKNGKSAYGYRFLKPGFSFSEQMDLAFALGFPSLVFVIDGHPDDADPLGNLNRWRVYEHACLPAMIARYLVRDHAWGHPVVKGEDDEWLATRDDPITEAEMLRLVPQCLDEMYSTLALYRWEALTSTDEVLEVVLAELERQVAEKDENKLEDSCNVGVVESAVPAMLLRTTEPTRDTHRRTLGALHKRLSGAADMRRAIDLALDRGKKDKTERWRVHGSVTPEEYVRWLRDREIDESMYPDVRDAFLGGERAIEVMRKRWREYKAVAKESIVSQYGWVRSEQTVLLFLDLLGTAPKLKTDVKKWLVEHADYARPILLDLEKKSGPTALLARNALKHLDARHGGPARPAKKK